jgi:hypothetical protein
MIDGDDKNVEPLEYARMKRIRPLPTRDNPFLMRLLSVFVLSAIVLVPLLIGILALIWVMIFV